MIRIAKDQTFVAYHWGVRCLIPFMTKTRTYKLSRWSALENVLSYLSNLDTTAKMETLFEQIAAMEPKQVGSQFYSAKLLVRAYQYYASSRSLYRHLRLDFQLPSESVLSRITSSYSKSKHLNSSLQS